ncbi:sugar ABC transporter permease [Paenibacillus baekrokdamisoli]|uniref:Sugar ABC transporter permease n=1 Tax=Paenibacillus baekrokdamisoli TaxID=1712516 RepID=A0A3G9J963_9BACL|nr:sugar ABC transporter permease [Paenibacillus baekrokdamisoli]MBB3069541.1 multiple sugar transport system permease protein [Paenibacillus baekrokdamisoli]BBH24885.1 sugar ABC transporter permease [Paenibacillus baekrokdamisoli]
MRTAARPQPQAQPQAQPQVRTSFRPRIPWTPILFLTPAIIAFLLFKYYPLFQAVYMSFFDYKVINPPGHFVWLDNYKYLIHSTEFWNALFNTFAFFFIYFVLTFWVPIVQAILLNEVRYANKTIRVLYLLPTAVPAVAGYLLWKWLYNPDYGLLNYLLHFVGLGPYGWLNDPAMAKWAIVFPGVFGTGMSMLIYYSALQGIPSENIEAAKIDGAGPWRRMSAIVFPSLKFVIGIQFIAFISGVFLTFDPMYIMTGGGPANSTRTLSMLVFNSSFKEFRFGVAGAISFVMFIIIAVITFLQIRLTNKE